MTRRVSMRRLAPLGASVLLSAVVLAACGAAPASGPSPTPVQIGPPATSDQGPGPTSAASASASPAPAPTTPSPLGDLSALDRLVVRRTNAFPQNTIRFSFPAEVAVTDSGRVHAVARALLDLPLPPTGPIHCPADLGIVYRLTFFAGGRALPLVTVQATGCQVVEGLGAPRWAATSPDFWHTLGEAMGLANADYATFRGNGP